MDLRTFVKRLEEVGELKRIKRPVDPEYEIGAVCFKELRRGIENNKALLFEQVRGSAMPLVTNLLASEKRLHLALNVSSPEQWRGLWLERTARPLAPIITDKALCQDTITENVDLSQIPIPLWNEKDGGRYLTMSCVIYRDPQTGERNCGIYRLMVLPGLRRLGVFAVPYHHLGRQLNQSFAEGKSLPVAVALGVSPAITIAAASDFPYGVDELAMAGALQGEPVALARCRTVSLEVPADTEIVLEGEIRPGAEAEEGPFGEFTGYYGGARALRPVIEIHCMTYRKNPLAVGSYVGRPPNENAFLNSQTTAVEITRQCPLPGIRDLYVNPSGVLNAVVSVRTGEDGDAETIGRAIFSTEAGRRIKTVIVVDEDIDLRDSDEVSWAMAYRMRPQRDVKIIENQPGVSLDPSLDLAERLAGTNRTSKLIIDATKPLKEPFAEECLPQQEMLKRVEAEWESY
jgi:UbiD family decarboxylase